jgi:hypothetical protein
MAIPFADKLTRRVDRLTRRLEKLETSFDPNGKRIQKLRGKINELLDQLGLPPLEEPTPPGLASGPAFTYNIPEGWGVDIGSPYIYGPQGWEMGQNGFRFQITSPTPVLITHLGTGVPGTDSYLGFDFPTEVTIYDEMMNPIVSSQRPYPFDQPTQRIGYTEFWELKDPVTLQPYRIYTILGTIDKDYRYLLVDTNREGGWGGWLGQAEAITNAVQTNDWLTIQEPIGINNTSGRIPLNESWPLSWSGLYDRFDGTTEGWGGVVLGPNMLAQVP